MANSVATFLLLVVVGLATFSCIQASSKHKAKSKHANYAIDTCEDEFWGGYSCQQPGGSSKGGDYHHHGQSKGGHSKHGKGSKGKGGKGSKEYHPECDYCREDRWLCKPVCRDNRLTDDCPPGCCRDSPHCWDINECEENPCPTNSYCVNTVGSYLCHCDEGYRWNDYHTACIDINECEENPCPTNSYCVNTVGSYLSHCDEGYIWNDYHTACIGVEPHYLGCYKDKPRSRALPHGTPLLFGNNGMTLELCFNHCKSQGKRYAGVEHRVQCFCGDDGADYDRYGARPETDCSYPCGGNADQFCGGTKRMNVYDITHYVIPDAYIVPSLSQRNENK